MSEPLGGPFRHGNRNQRNIYFGTTQHIAVVVGEDEDIFASFLVMALNAYWQAGNRPEVKGSM